MPVHEIEEKEVAGVPFRNLHEELLELFSGEELNRELRSRSPTRRFRLPLPMNRYSVVFPHFRQFVKPWKRHSALEAELRKDASPGASDLVAPVRVRDCKPGGDSGRAEPPQQRLVRREPYRLAGARELGLDSLGS